MSGNCTTQSCFSIGAGRLCVWSYNVCCIFSDRKGENWPKEEGQQGRSPAEEDEAGPAAGSSSGSRRGSQLEKIQNFVTSAFNKLSFGSSKSKVSFISFSSGIYFDLKWNINFLLNRSSKNPQLRAWRATWNLKNANMWLWWQARQKYIKIDLVTWLLGNQFRAVNFYRSQKLNVFCLHNGLSP